MIQNLWIYSKKYCFDLGRRVMELTPRQQDSADVHQIKESYTSQQYDNKKYDKDSRQPIRASVGAVWYDDETKTMYICYGVINGRYKWRPI
jgi:hypothetical protein